VEIDLTGAFGTDIIEGKICGGHLWVEDSLSQIGFFTCEVKIAVTIHEAESVEYAD
jgi:hypothetical protein